MEISTGWQGSYDDAADTLVEASEEDLLVDSIGGLVEVEAIVVWRLESCLESVERIDKQIDRESSECAGLDK